MAWLGLGLRGLGALALVAALAACAPLRGVLAPREGEALSLSELADEGDPARRASLRLVLRGLDADAEGQLDVARSDYERALQVDPSNPYAYLALARHHVDGTTPERALPFLDKASALLDAEEANSPRVDVHLVGLRGAALMAAGRIDEAWPLLERAQEMAPTVWSDAALSPQELR